MKNITNGVIQLKIGIGSDQNKKVSEKKSETSDERK